jgi:hypothetical protein
MNTSADEFERNLGPEWDEALLLRLRQAVSNMGGDMKETSWAVGGSQEIITYDIRLRGLTLTATAETYIGLLLRGPRSVVDEIAELVFQIPGDDALRG